MGNQRGIRMSWSFETYLGQRVCVVHRLDWHTFAAAFTFFLYWSTLAWWFVSLFSPMLGPTQWNAKCFPAVIFWSACETSPATPYTNELLMAYCATALPIKGWNHRLCGEGNKEKTLQVPHFALWGRAKWVITYSSDKHPTYLPRAVLGGAGYASV